MRVVPEVPLLTNKKFYDDNKSVNHHITRIFLITYIILVYAGNVGKHF